MTTDQNDLKLSLTPRGTVSVPMPLHPMSDRVTKNHLEILKDEPGPGGASHQYLIRGPFGDIHGVLIFQQGPLGENNLNGLVSGTVLQVMIDHLRGFQKGEFPSRENACAITHLEEALFWLKSRELEREQRGVLGYNQK